MTIYQQEPSIFKPTYLYIKQHTVTFKLYFGKTTRNPEKYMGSGKHWINHIKKHGKKFVINLWYELFTDKNEIREFALKFSKDMNIVESSQWLNLIPENGLHGGYSMTGKKHTKEAIQRMRDIRLGIPLTGEHAIKVRANAIKVGKANKGKKRTDENKEQISSTLIGHVRTEESRKKQSITTKGVKKSKEHAANISKARMGIPRPNKGIPNGPHGPTGPQPIVICPHCLKEGGNNSMHRWHFDNCKYKI